MMIDRLSAGWQLWLMNMTDDPDREAAGRRLSLARTGALAAIAIFAVAAGIFSGLAVFGPQRDGGGSPSLELERSAPSNGLSRFVRLAEPQDIPDLTFNDAEGKPRRPSEWHAKAEGREIARFLGPADWDSPEAAAKIEGLLRGKGG